MVSTQKISLNSNYQHSIFGSSLNMVAFTKILKKFDKVRNICARHIYKIFLLFINNPVTLFGIVLLVVMG